MGKRGGRSQAAPATLSVERALTRRPASDALVVALRASLRALPAALARQAPAGLDDEHEYEIRVGDDGVPEEVIAAAFRATSAIWLSLQLGGSYNALGYLARNVALSSEKLFNTPAAHVGDALFATLETAIDVVNAAVHASEAADGAAQACNIASPRQSAGRSAADEVFFDIEALKSGASAASLATTPLWRDGNPEWHSRLWNEAKLRLRQAKQGWEVWFGWYEDRLRGEGGIIELEKARVTEVGDSDWSAGPAIANTKIREIIDRFAALTLTNSFSIADNDQDSPPITAAGDELQFSAITAGDDARVSARPGMEVEYANIRRSASALSRQVTEWVTSDCHPDWRELRTDVARLNRMLRPDLQETISQISVVWAAGVAVAQYLDQDRQLRNDPNSGNAPALPLPLRNKLTTFVQVFAAWLLEFPTVRQREENAHSFSNAIDRLHSAEKLVGHVRRSEALRPTDLELLEELIRVAAHKGGHASKARFWSYNTLKRIVLTAGRILTTATAGAVISNAAESSILIQRLTKLLIEGESAVIEFASDLPASTREALLGLIEQLRENASSAPPTI